MRLKKFLSLAMASAILTLTMATGVTAFADLSSTGQSEPKSVKVKTNNPGTKSYYVAIDWGNLEFEYKFGSKEWNHETHTYGTNEQDPGWQGNTTTITVTNHSNASVNVSMKYIPGNQNYGISGEITGGNRTLESAEGKAAGEADYLTATFTISGTPDTTLASYTDVGTLMVTVQP